jgi:hypothetical protein
MISNGLDFEDCPMAALLMISVRVRAAPLDRPYLHPHIHDHIKFVSTILIPTKAGLV